MADAEPQRKPAEPALKRQSLWCILLESLRLYARHWQPFTRVLLLPMVYILIGTYSCLILAQLFVNTVADHYMGLAQQHMVLFLGLVALIVLGTLSLFFKGFWQYAVYWTSLNLNANEVINGYQPDIPAAYQLIGQQKRVAYKLLLLAYSLLPGMALVIFLVCGALSLLLSSMQNAMAAGGLFLVGLIFSTLLILFWVVLTIPMSLAFQVLVFQPTASNNPVPILLESARLVMKRLWTTVGLQLILFMSTNYVLTMPVAFLFRLLHLATPLDALHHWILNLVLGNMTNQPDSNPTVQQLTATLHGMVPELARGWTGSTVMLIMTALLLPLGTFVFTLLYRDIMRTAAVSESPPDSTDNQSSDNQ